MKASVLFGIVLILCACICSKLIWAKDADNLQDTCPADTARKNIFVNGFPCKNPAEVIASDFKSSLLSKKGDTDNFLGSSTNILTAAKFPGLNTLGLSVARTDFEVDGLVLPHSNPRASEMVFVSSGRVVAGFVDTKGRVFQKILNEGDVFVFPRGLLHYFYNIGFEFATVFSVLSSQNPGVVGISDAQFTPDNDDSDSMKTLIKKLKSLSNLDVDRIDNATLLSYGDLPSNPWHLQI
ncbi:PREDICTED: germin-like protein 11-1 [Ipomoea nil]|uniref:germin-like protein 11-1 n=1 Tax=Ipomoea nil TaxID=35883 RepID=UPI0009018CEA|nr:PREDICTED: germin-like protein 11-1 [Ipomoea nil]